jgi:hypothetical protein
MRKPLVTGRHLSWASMPPLKRLLAPALLSLACVACSATAPRGLTRAERGLLAGDLAHTRPAGIGRSFRPPAASRRVRIGAPVGPWRCLRHRSTSYGAHIELFARSRGIVVPPGIGISQPVRTGAYVVGGRCRYPLRTVEPTGVVRVDASAGEPHLGELFALWGQPLSSTRLGAFNGRVTAYVDGARWRGDPRTVPLRRHNQIVLETGAYVAPHASYGFPPGL